MLNAMWILVDAEGFTTSVGAYHDMTPTEVVYRMNVEVSRRPLHAPIRVFYWKLYGVYEAYCRDTLEWRRENVFLWDGRTI